MKILWAITGAGHLLEETINFMKKISEENEITIAFSNAGIEVVRMYNFFNDIEKISKNILMEKNQGKSFPFIGKLSKKEFSYLFVAPCTANTIAKIAYGIADSFVSNLVAQALKNKIPVIILPTDFRKKEKVKTPKGREVVVYIRDIDIDNVKKIEKMQGIKVVRDFKEIKF